jgi:hypothetical protein
MASEAMLTTETSPATARPAYRPPVGTGDDWQQRAKRVLSGDRKPEDYLPVPDEVREAVERDMGYFRERLGGAEPVPKVAADQLEIYLLAYHHGGQNIGYVGDDRGIVVVAVGLEQIAYVCQVMPYSLTEHMAFAAPEPIWGI